MARTRRRRISASGPWLSSETYVPFVLFSACIRLQLSTLLPMFTKTWQTRGHGENVRVISWLRPRENILPQIHNRQQLHKPSNQYLSISATYVALMDRKKNIYIHMHIEMQTWDFLPPFGLCCFGCGRNIYDAVVRVICPHKASAALWKRCKYGPPPSFSCSLQRWVKRPRNILKFFNSQTKLLRPFHRRCWKTLKMMMRRWLTCWISKWFDQGAHSGIFCFFVDTLVWQVFFWRMSLMCQETFIYFSAKQCSLWSVKVLCFKDLFWLNQFVMIIDVLHVLRFFPILFYEPAQTNSIDHNIIWHWSLNKGSNLVNKTALAVIISKGSFTPRTFFFVAESVTCSKFNPSVFHYM